MLLVLTFLTQRKSFDCITGNHLHLVAYTVFGSECWTLAKQLEEQIQTADLKVIRLIQGVTKTEIETKI